MKWWSFKVATHLAWSPLEETELDRICVVHGFLFKTWSLKTECSVLKGIKVQHKEASQHLLPPRKLNDLCPPFSCLGHKQIVSILTLVWAVFILLSQKIICFCSIKHLFCVIWGPVLGSMCEAMWGVGCGLPLGTSLWERWPYIQWIHSHRLEKDAHAYSSHFCERDEHYTVSSVVWNLAHRDTQSFLFESKN